MKHRIVDDDLVDRRLDTAVAGVSRAVVDATVRQPTRPTRPTSKRSGHRRHTQQSTQDSHRKDTLTVRFMEARLVSPLSSRPAPSAPRTSAQLLTLRASWATDPATRQEPSPGSISPLWTWPRRSRSTPACSGGRSRKETGRATPRCAQRWPGGLPRGSAGHGEIAVWQPDARIGAERVNDVGCLCMHVPIPDGSIAIAPRSTGRGLRTVRGRGRSIDP